jgi:hypothetical protein
MKPGPKKYDRIPSDVGALPGPFNYAHEHVVAMGTKAFKNSYMRSDRSKLA